MKFHHRNSGGVDKVTKSNGEYVATKEAILDIMRQAHIETGHGGEKKSQNKLSEKYANIPLLLIGQYISHFEGHRQERATGVLVRHLSVNDSNERGQVDLVDMQTMKERSYHFIMHYMEYLTKFHIICPLKSKTAAEVTHELLLIFLDIGAPHILQSDNGREFTAQVIHKLATI
ncbi:KRAB-A domain-containing protein 2-like [Carcharodon carcharias]|uniref:KRAB-A domain-containing protein 2-like n=1 Tax=Carcharodon carcharias TaxID=13397 RepID=UPI001B7DECF4|nr:KRAB-A domain-containing protein 2-like [Carcharodon carcharias]